MVIQRNGGVNFCDDGVSSVLATCGQSSKAPLRKNMTVNLNN